jgi:hypothetical protein
MPMTQQEARTKTDREKSCRDFVQGFYDWYLSPVKKDREHPEGELGMGDAISFRRGDMSAELYSLLKADHDAQAHANAIVGLDFDPFTNSQDNSPKFEVKSAVVQNDDCRAVVWGMDAGTHRETVEPEATEKNSAWNFVNFHYRDGSKGGSTLQDSDLIEILKENALDRQRERKMKR